MGSCAIDCARPAPEAQSIAQLPTEEGYWVHLLNRIIALCPLATYVDGTERNQLRNYEHGETKL